MRPLLLVLMLVLSGCATVQGSLYDLGVASERDRAGLRPRTLEFDGYTLHYLERPGNRRDAETVVLIHGFAGSKEHWIRLVRYLPPRYRVLVPDLPGHGDNAPDTTCIYSIAYLTDAVAALIDEQANAHVYLVGNSLGGRIAAELALDEPERLRALALLDPAGVPSPTPSALDSALARGENLLIPTSRTEQDRFFDIAFGDKPPELPWPAEAVLARRSAARAPIYRAVWNDIGAEVIALPERLPDLRVPTLLLWGLEDGILDPSAADRWAALVPEIDLELLPGVGHAPMLEQPEATAERLVRFFAAHRR